MTRTATFAVAIALGLLAVCAAAAPSRDGATIVDSGSTNTAGYSMNVWSDGNAVVTLQNRAGEAQDSPKSFTIAPAVVSKFFADLKTARAGGAASVPCMKSASFGTSTHVTWHGWRSPDLDCPAGNALTAALVRDVTAIRGAGNVQSVPLHRMPPGPPHLEMGTPAATPSA